MSRKVLLVVFLVAAMGIAGVVSYWASTRPDGLDRSIELHGLQPAAATAPEGSPPASPLADYKLSGVDSPFLSNGLAGLIGALLVLAVLLALGYLLTRKHRPPAPADPRRAEAPDLPE